MLEIIKKELLSFGIEEISAIPLSLCRITRQYKLDKCGLTNSDRLFAVMLAVPYYTDQINKNISSYAVTCDYHIFFKQLFDTVLPKLRATFPQNRFSGFADDSPIDERHAAALSGLGILGDNGMLITEKYSSYVFLAEIITDMRIATDTEYEIKYCEHCGKCSEACPKRELGECLSALTQKKGELSLNESAAIKKYGSAWGCDRCTEVCPHTKRSRERGTLCTNIPFFVKELIPTVTYETVSKMTDNDFSLRAYSWRGRETILRNLKILEEET